MSKTLMREQFERAWLVMPNTCGDCKETAWAAWQTAMLAAAPSPPSAEPLQGDTVKNELLHGMIVQAYKEHSDSFGNLKHDDKCQVCRYLNYEPAQQPSPPPSDALREGNLIDLIDETGRQFTLTERVRALLAAPSADQFAAADAELHAVLPPNVSHEVLETMPPLPKEWLASVVCGKVLARGKSKTSPQMALAIGIINFLKEYQKTLSAPSAGSAGQAVEATGWKVVDRDTRRVHLLTCHETEARKFIEQRTAPSVLIPLYEHAPAQAVDQQARRYVTCRYCGRCMDESQECWNISMSKACEFRSLAHPETQEPTC